MGNKMPIAVVWDNDEKSIILSKFTDPWDWNDFYMAGQTAAMLAGTVNHTVAFINDITDTRSLPTNAMVHFRSINRAGAPNIDLVLIVGGDTYTKMMIEMFQRLNKNEPLAWTIVNSMDEARALIAKKRQQSE